MCIVIVANACMYSVYVMCTEVPMHVVQLVSSYNVFCASVKFADVPMCVHAVPTCNACCAVVKFSPVNACQQ